MRRADNPYDRSLEKSLACFGGINLLTFPTCILIHEHTPWSPALPAPPRRALASLQSCGSCGGVFLKLFLDFFFIRDTISFVDNSAWSAGACSRFSFLRQPFRPLANLKQPKSRPLESATYEMLFL